MIGIYTALFGSYDVIRQTKYNGVLFTDQDIDDSLGWKIERVEKPHSHNGYASRYYFNQSCLVMPDFEYTIMHGANATLKVHPHKLVEMLPLDIDLACCIHPRGNVYDEAKACIRMGKDNKSIIQQQMNRYKEEGFNGKGLSACIILVRRNTPALKEFETMLWNEVENNSLRDQLAFDYVRWKLDFPIARLPEHWKNYLDLRGHSK